MSVRVYPWRLGPSFGGGGGDAGLGVGARGSIIGAANRLRSQGISLVCVDDIRCAFPRRWNDLANQPGFDLWFGIVYVNIFHPLVRFTWVVLSELVSRDAS